MPEEFPVGPYIVSGGIGHHDLLITRDHEKNIEHLMPAQANKMFEILQQRYQMLATDKCLVYTSTFFNWGPRAGASLYHPHYQILTLPIVPPDVNHSLEGSKRYFRANKKCVHCVMIEFEERGRTRIIAQNEHAIAFAPFVSRSPFEVRVFPRQHQPFFEKTPKNVMEGVVSILQQVLQKMTHTLNDPDRNFFIHAAPLKKQATYNYYHWHIEIIPKITVPGGFELSTGIDINVVSPEQTAQLLLGK
jgi:UDPglucose--hexose-1-phosphate uridylyltransferase